MKLRTLTCIAGMTLFALLAIPSREPLVPGIQRDIHNGGKRHGFRPGLRSPF